MNILFSNVRHKNKNIYFRFRCEPKNLQRNSTWCQNLNTTFQLLRSNWTELEFPNAVKKEIRSSFIQHWKNRTKDRGTEKKLDLYLRQSEEGI